MWPIAGYPAEERASSVLAKLRISNRGLGVGLFALLFLIYFLIGGYSPLNDARINVLTADSLLWEGDLVFARTEIPDMFAWLGRTPAGDYPVEISFLDERLRRMIDDRAIVPNPSDERFRYVVAPTADPDRFVNTFGVGAAVAALPVLAPVTLATGRLADHPDVLLWSSKLAAATLVAASATLVFLAVGLYASPRRAVLVALAYGLGTGVWSTSSQALWQHGPNDFFLALAAWQLARLDLAPGAGRAAGVAVAVAAATFCRPTSAMVAIVFGLYLAARHRRQLHVYCLAGAPLAALLLAYNQYFFGHPLLFGQTRITNLALQKTGTAAIWQSGLLEGAAGLLVSPSRGLLIYSPFLLFGIWGAARAWRNREFLLGRALGPAALAIGTVECFHFDWWGGWSYGYRHIVDTAVYLSLLLVPVLPRLARSKVLGTLFALSLGWSILVQFLGAVAVDLEGWNAAKTYRVRVHSTGQEFEVSELSPVMRATLPADARIEVVHRNVDEPAHRARLWSWRENQICYHLAHWSQGRAAKQRLERITRSARPVRLAAAYAQLADGFARAGDAARTDEFLATSLAYDPASHEALVVKGTLLLARAEGKPYAEVAGSRAELFGVASSNEPHLEMGNRLGRPRPGRPGWLREDDPLERGEWEKGARELAQLVQADPSAAGALHGLGLARYEQGRVAEAIEHLRRAARLAPADGDTLADLGTVLARAGDRQGARECILGALRLRPADATLQRRLERLDDSRAEPPGREGAR